MIQSRKTLLALAVAATTMGAFSCASAGGLTLADLQARQEVGTDQLLFKFRPGAAASMASPALREAANRYGVNITGSRLGSIGHIVKLDKRLPNAVAQKLAEEMKAADPALEAAQADAWATIAGVPNDTLWSSQWHYFEPTGGINVVKAWKRSKGKKVVVAVLDTGYRPHADLVANLVPGYDMIVDTAVANDGNGRDADASDPGDGCGGASSWHGTHVAGTIAAVTNNGVGVAGVAQKSKVQSVRVLGCGGGYFSDIDAGIEWASGGTVAGLPANPTPAKVINMSLSGATSCPAATQTAINNAVARGTVVVVAAGNAYGNAASYAPANCANVITVAATNRSGAKASYSNTGTVVEIAAPGGDFGGTGSGVLSTLNAGYSTPGADNYVEYVGTSMATPHVAGVAALIMAKQPTWTPAQVLARIQSTARAFPGACAGCGSGIVDANAAVP